MSDAIMIFVFDLLLLLCMGLHIWPWSRGGASSYSCVHVCETLFLYAPQHMICGFLTRQACEAFFSLETPNAYLVSSLTVIEYSSD